MSKTRRFVLAIFPGCVAALFIPRAFAKPPELPISARRGFEVMFPRGTVLGMDIGATQGGGSISLISTGSEWIPAASPEGEAIAREQAVNLRSDGTLRHRQHHWPRQ